MPIVKKKISYFHVDLIDVENACEYAANDLRWD